MSDRHTASELHASDIDVYLWMQVESAFER